jgi:hypothetical protein
MGAARWPMHASSATVEVVQPRLFTLGAVLTVNAYGLALAAPFLMSILVVSLIPFGVLTVLIPFLVVAGTAYFLPFGLGNTHITRLVRSLRPAASQGGKGFVVQLTLSPRIRSGFRAILEDADDIGHLSFTSAGLVFDGDSVRLFVPYDHIEQVRPQNIGLRGLFVYGRRIKIMVSGLPEAEALEFAERSSWFLPASSRITRQLCERLAAGVAAGTNGRDAERISA